MGKYKDNPRYNVITVRVSEDERKSYLALASRFDLSVSDMMRRAVQDLAHNDSTERRVG